MGDGVVVVEHQVKLVRWIAYGLVAFAALLVIVVVDVISGSLVSTAETQFGKQLGLGSYLLWLGSLLSIGLLCGMQLRYEQRAPKPIRGRNVAVIGVILDATALSLIGLLATPLLPQSRFFLAFPALVQAGIVIYCCVSVTMIVCGRHLPSGSGRIPRPMKSKEQLCAFLTICEMQPNLLPGLVGKLQCGRERIAALELPTLSPESRGWWDDVGVLVKSAHREMMSGNRVQAEALLDTLIGALDQWPGGMHKEC